jgi:hypothetical protein
MFIIALGRVIDIPTRTLIFIHLRPPLEWDIKWGRFPDYPATIGGIPWIERFFEANGRDRISLLLHGI